MGGTRAQRRVMHGRAVAGTSPLTALVSSRGSGCLLDRYRSLNATPQEPRPNFDFGTGFQWVWGGDYGWLWTRTTYLRVNWP